MMCCSHGLPIEERCQECTSEALSSPALHRPPCWGTYWIAGQGCKHPKQQGPKCAGCAYHLEGNQA